MRWRFVKPFCLVACIARLAFPSTQENLVGKTPETELENQNSPSTPRLEGKTLDAPVLSFDTQQPSGPAHTGLPAPLVTLPNALAFIHAQRGLHGAGLPALFWARPDLVLKDPLQQLLVQEGVGLYDTALAILTLIDTGALDEARHLLDIYRSGQYAEGANAPMELRATPSRYNNGAFKPFDADVYYYFDFTNVHGDWLRWGERWKFWTVHTGPNAWLANAVLHYVMAARLRGISESQLKPYVALADMLGHAMQRLQDKEAQGGVRYGPENVWHEMDASAPYFEINSENNVSAYATFQLLARVTGKPAYAQSAERILHWFTAGEVWDAQGNKRTGLMDAPSGTLPMGAIFKDNRWVLQTEHPTDAGGTWTISALGAETIDRLWGPGAAYRMWRTIRSRSGRSANFGAVGPQNSLAGLDFMDGFPIQESLISPEWSGGGLFALRELIAYYRAGLGRGILSEAQVLDLEKDLSTMDLFIRQNPNPYALGPGHGGTRQGATGFRWFSPPPEVHAMASLYFTLATTGQPDPLGDWRLLQQKEKN